MRFLETDLGQRRRGTVVRVTLQGNAANVVLVDFSGLSNFRSRRAFTHYGGGGFAKRSPVDLIVPHDGHWYVVVYLPGAGGQVRSSVQILPGPLAPIRQSASTPLGRIAQAAAEVPDASGEAEPDKRWDVFICHATEDKEEIVRPLALALRERDLAVWYDEFELKLGDSLRRSIDRGIGDSRFGLVVLSQAFFTKNWPQRELDGLVTREMTGEQIILPIWHNVSKAEVLRYSAPLADKVALRTSDATIAEVANTIADVVAEQGA